MLYGALGQWAFGQTQGAGAVPGVVLTPGLEAIGGFALGQGSRQSSSGGIVISVNGAAGGGIVGGFAGTPVGVVAGVSGGGVVGPLYEIETIVPPRAVGIGVVGAIAPTTSNLPHGAAGVGVAGSIYASGYALDISATGVGVAGTVASFVRAEAIGGAVGAGLAGTIGAPAFSYPAAAFGVGIAGKITVTVSGGGTSWRKNTGLEPVRKRPPQNVSAPKPKPLVPPAGLFRAPPPPIAPRYTTPVDDIGDGLQSTDFMSVMARIEAATKETERNRHDEADIADIMAMLELIDD